MIRFLTGLDEVKKLFDSHLNLSIYDRMCWKKIERVFHIRSSKTKTLIDCNINSSLFLT